MYCIGHLVLAMYETPDGLALGLGLIALGSGGIKPCVSAHVGDQFDESNKSLLSTVFNYFYVAINFGSFVSTLATPLLLQFYGPSIAFGIPGGLMLIATFLFWLGRKEFVHIKPFGKGFLKILFSKEGLASIGRLSVVYVFIAFFWALFDQTGSTWVTQAKSSFMDKSISFMGWDFTLLPSQLQSVNPVLVLVLVPLFTLLIYPVLNKVMKMTPLRKIALGLIISAFSFVVIGFAEAEITQGNTVGISYQVWAYLIITVAEVLVSITALEFSYSQAPNEMKSFIMSLFLFSVSLGNGVTVLVTRFMVEDVAIEKLEATDNKTLVYVNEVNDYVLGEKFNINSSNGLHLLYKKDTVPLTGTFLVGHMNAEKQCFTLWDIDRKDVASFGSYEANEKSEYSIFKLKGADYFYFFALMMAVVGFLFIIVSENYKGKTYIQSENEQE